MQQRHKLEEETGKVVSTAQALDILLRGTKEDERRRGDEESKVK